MTQAVASEGKLSVFISYSRDDLDFADQLAAALSLHDILITLDRHGISGGEDWKSRLGGLIRDADTVVFVLSPSSARSDICAWEVAEAARLGKRIIPVLCRSLEDTSPPAALAALNYIFFYPEPKTPGTGFGTGLVRLLQSLRTDLDWLREHTRLLQRAIEWDANARADSRLLFGDAITEARAWAGRRPPDAPEPTTLHLEFIRASEELEARRASEERRHLEAMAAVQEERQRALEAAEEAQKEREVAIERTAEAQRTALRSQQRLVWGGAAAVLILTAVAWWSYAILEERRTIAREASREDIRGQVVAFATAEGAIALDTAPGMNTSPYSTALVSNLVRSNRSVVEGITDAHNEVTKLSNGEQRPFISTSLNGHIYLGRQPASRAKQALIISVEYSGNPGASLVAPKHDAEAMKKALTELGFKGDEIRVLSNPTRDEAEKAVTELGKALAERAAGRRSSASLSGAASAGLAPEKDDTANTLGFLYFTGTGFSHGGENYLLFPRSDKEDFSTNEKIVEQSMKLDWLTKTLKDDAAASIVVFDAMFNQVSMPDANNVSTPETTAR